MIIYKIKPLLEQYFDVRLAVALPLRYTLCSFRSFVLQYKRYYKRSKQYSAVCRGSRGRSLSYLVEATGSPYAPYRLTVTASSSHYSRRRPSVLFVVQWDQTNIRQIKHEGAGPLSCAQHQSLEFDSWVKKLMLNNKYIQKMIFYDWVVIEEEFRDVVGKRKVRGRIWMRRLHSMVQKENLKETAVDSFSLQKWRSVVQLLASLSL